MVFSELAYYLCLVVLWRTCPTPHPPNDREDNRNSGSDKGGNEQYRSSFQAHINKLTFFSVSNLRNKIFFVFRTWFMMRLSFNQSVKLEWFMTCSGSRGGAQWWEHSPPTNVAQVELLCLDGFSPGSLVFPPQQKPASSGCKLCS